MGEFGDLDDAEALELHGLAREGMAALTETFAPQGFNLGWNLGRIAGAADVKVLPEHLAETRRKLAAAWPLAG